MADYATIDDVFKRYPLVANVVGSGANLVASNDISSIYIADAQSLVNGYIANRYAVPLSVEPMVTWLTADIAIYRLFEDKLPRFPEAVEKRYTNAMSILWQINAGNIILTTNTPLSGTGDQEVWSSAASYAGVIFRPAEEITNCQSVWDPFFHLDRF